MRKIILLIGVIICVAGSVLVSESPAHANTPSIEICQLSGALCLNRDGGGLRFGTQGISYFGGDKNNDAEYLWLPGICGAGVVTPDCPNFNNSNINREVAGAIIVEIEMGVDHTQSPNCLGLNGTLHTCTDGNGNCPHGANCDNVWFVVQNCGNIVNCGGVESAVLNIVWSYYHHSPSWLEIPNPAGAKIVIGKETGSPETIVEFNG